MNDEELIVGEAPMKLISNMKYYSASSQFKSKLTLVERMRIPVEVIGIEQANNSR